MNVSIYGGEMSSSHNGGETSSSRKADRLLLSKGKIYFSVSSLNIFIQEFLDAVI